MNRAMTKKTNAARLLDRLHLSYDLLEYDLDDDGDAQGLLAQSVAHHLGLPAPQVFKTLVMRGDRQGVCFAVVPSHCQLRLKALAQMTGDRKIEAVSLKEVQPLTGYIRGGVTALASKKDYPVYGDLSLTTFERVAVSAGKRGLMLWLAPQDYIQATGIILGPLGEPMEP
jgi:Cys-tRNA(Pro)/Cys-tRNA(Cys) deacylase